MRQHFRLQASDADTFLLFFSKKVVAATHPSFCLPPPPQLLVGLFATLGWSVIHFWNLCITIIKGGFEARFSSWDSPPQSTVEYFKSRGSHFNLAYHQLHLPWLPARPPAWHFKKNMSPDVVFNERVLACGGQGYQQIAFKEGGKGAFDGMRHQEPKQVLIDYRAVCCASLFFFFFSLRLSDSN